MNDPQHYPKEHLRSPRHNRCRHGRPVHHFCQLCNAEARVHPTDPRPIVEYVPRTTVQRVTRNRDAR